MRVTWGTMQMEYIHGLDIVHRDIKLENVLLDGRGRTNAKLVDFGFSAHVKNRRLLHVFCGAYTVGKSIEKLSTMPQYIARAFVQIRRGNAQ